MYLHTSTPKSISLRAYLGFMTRDLHLIKTSKKERKKERKSAEDGCTTAFHKEIKIYDS
jgi:hypothetical protein